MRDRTPQGAPNAWPAALRFFVLVFALAVPFWLIGTLTELQLLPGLPVSALSFICPGAAALILAYASRGSAGAVELLKRAFDVKRISAKVWYAPALLLVPAVTVLGYVLMRLTGLPLPAPQFPLLAAVSLGVVFFVAALGEELGWSGYAVDPLQDRSTALEAAILVGLVWAAVHYVPLVQAHRTVSWIAWWSLGTVALRVLIVWLYNNTGRSVFAATLCHASANLSWQLFPVHGSSWDPRINGLLVAGVAAIVILVWGPKTLTGRNVSRANRREAP